MADVEMPDAAPSAPAKSKAPGTKIAKSGGAGAEGDGKKRFEVKKWNAVALWAWDIVVDNCAICRNHIMDLCMTHYCILLNKYADYFSRHRVSGKPGVSYERRVHSCMGHLQCESAA